MGNPPSCNVARCFQECERSNENLVDFAITTTWQECSLLCLNSSECSAFTFYGQNSDVLPHNSCFLFSDCRTEAPCNDCVIGLPQQDCLCSISYLGTMDASNFANFVFETRPPVRDSAPKMRPAKFTLTTTRKLYPSFQLRTTKVCHPV